MSSAKIDRLRGVTLAAPTAPDTIDFYSRVWGLDVVAETDRAAYLRGTGPEHHILTLLRGPVPRLEMIEFGAADRNAVEALHRAAGEAGVEVTAPAELTAPGGGYGFELLDPEKRRLRISAGVASHADAANVTARPMKIAHIVLNTPQVEAMRKFYCDLFGFVVSDWSEDQMVFIRCNDDHHNIAFNKAEYASLNHVSFQMPGYELVMKGLGRLKDNDCPVKWGVGCHGIGDIMFAYFIDPNGFAIEYNHYVRAFDPSRHEAKIWQRSRDIMDAWGSAGLPGPEIRRAMAGIPESSEA